LVSSSIFFIFFYKKSITQTDGSKSETNNQNQTASSLSIPKEYESEIREFFEFKQVLQELGLPKLERVKNLSKAKQILNNFMFCKIELEKVEGIKKQVVNLKGNDPSQISRALTFFKCLFSINNTRKKEIMKLDIVQRLTELFGKGLVQKTPDNISKQAGFNLALIAFMGSKKLLRYLDEHKDLIFSLSLEEDLIKLAYARFKSFWYKEKIEFVKMGAIDLIGNLFLKVSDKDKSNLNISKTTAKLFFIAVTVQELNPAWTDIFPSLEILYAVLDKLFQFSEDEKVITYTIDISKMMIPNFRNWKGKPDLDQLIGNIYKHLLNLLHHKDPKFFIKVLHTLPELAAKSDVESEEIINTGLLEIFNELQDEDLRWAYLRAISDISALSSPKSQSIIDPKFYSYLKTMSDKDIPSSSLFDAVLALSNATRNYAMYPDQIELMVNQGVIGYFKNCLTSFLFPSGSYIDRVIRSLYEILEAGKLKLPKDSTDENPYVKLFIKLEIPDSIRRHLDAKYLNEETINVVKRIESFFPK
jgi:hypothetical protein